LRDRVFEVCLEVEKVRKEMGEMKTELCDRISGVEGSLRTEIAEFKKSAGRWLAFGMSL